MAKRHVQMTNEEKEWQNVMATLMTDIPSNENVRR